MTDVALHVHNLGKRYNIGGPQEPYGTLRDTLVSAALTPVRRVRAGGSTASRQHFWALRGVGFEVRHGEVVGVIGRNGAGKSTLLKILSRITEPTTGRATIHGRVGSLLEVGTGFHPELTGRENIYLNGAVLGMTKREIDRKFTEIVEFAEVERFLETPVKRYSSGMYMRLAFSIAAHLEPEILIVDEVLAVGDAAFQQKSLGKMSDVAKEGRTVLFVSHNMGAVLNLCTTGILLQGGSVVQDGPIRTTVEAYLQSMESTGEGDLSSHTDRRGKGELRFERVWFEDERGQVIDQGVAGQPLVIAMSYRSDIEGSSRNYRMSVRVGTNLGQPLFICSTEMTEHEMAPLEASGVVRCYIPELPLGQGRYTITLYAAVNRDVQDFIESAVPLNVIDGEFFGTGRHVPHPWQGKVMLVRHRWDASPEERQSPSVA